MAIYRAGRRVDQLAPLADPQAESPGKAHRLSRDYEEGDRPAVREAHDVDDNLVRAQESRRILDRLYGYTLSPVLWKKVQTGLSAGRVQSVAVRLIVDREEERLAFRTGPLLGPRRAALGRWRAFGATLTRSATSASPAGRTSTRTASSRQKRAAPLGQRCRRAGDTLEQHLPGASPRRSQARRRAACTRRSRRRR